MKRGEVIINTPEIPCLKVFVRPPFTDVSEPSHDEITEINKRHQKEYTAPEKDTILRIEPKLTEIETEALSLIKEYYEKGTMLLARELEKKLNIQGGTRQRLLDQMEKKRLIERVAVSRGLGRPSHGLIPLV